MVIKQDIKQRKQAIRVQKIEQRMLLSPAERSVKNRRIYEKVIEHPAFLRAKDVFIYVDLKSEVDTHALIGQTWQMGKRVAVPKVCGDVIAFYYIESLEDLSPGCFDVMEPTGNDSEAIPTKESLIVMPGVAFDTSLSRLGYGKSYYDRYLIKHNNVPTLALAYEIQLVEEIPTDIHDKPVDVLITEGQVL